MPRIQHPPAPDDDDNAPTSPVGSDDDTVEQEQLLAHDNNGSSPSTSSSFRGVLYGDDDGDDSGRFGLLFCFHPIGLCASHLVVQPTRYVYNNVLPASMWPFYSSSLEESDDTTSTATGEAEQQQSSSPTMRILKDSPARTAAVTTDLPASFGCVSSSAVESLADVRAAIASYENDLPVSIEVTSALSTPLLASYQSRRINGYSLARRRATAAPDQSRKDGQSEQNGDVKTGLETDEDERREGEVPQDLCVTIRGPMQQLLPPSRTARLSNVEDVIIEGLVNNCGARITAVRIIRCDFSDEGQQLYRQHNRRLNRNSGFGSNGSQQQQQHQEPSNEGKSNYNDEGNEEPVDGNDEARTDVRSSSSSTGGGDEHTDSSSTAKADATSTTNAPSPSPEEATEWARVARDRVLQFASTMLANGTAVNSTTVESTPNDQRPELANHLTLDNCTVTPLQLGNGLLQLPPYGLQQLIFHRCPLTDAHVSTLVLLARRQDGSRFTASNGGGLGNSHQPSSSQLFSSLRVLGITHGSLSKGAVHGLLRYFDEEVDEPSLSSLTLPSGTAEQTARRHPLTQRLPNLIVNGKRIKA